MIPNGFVEVPTPAWLLEWCAANYPGRQIGRCYETPSGRSFRFEWSGGTRTAAPAKRRQLQAFAYSALSAAEIEKRRAEARARAGRNEGDLFQGRKR